MIKFTITAIGAYDEPDYNCIYVYARTEEQAKIVAQKYIDRKGDPYEDYRLIREVVELKSPEPPFEMKQRSVGNSTIVALWATVAMKEIKNTSFARLINPS